MSTPDTSGTISITLNDEARVIPEGTTVAGLVEALGLAGAPCAAEVNRDVVSKNERSTVVLKSGDVVNLVTLVGGG